MYVIGNGVAGHRRTILAAMKQQISGIEYTVQYSVYHTMTHLLKI